MRSLLTLAAMACTLVLLGASAQGDGKKAPKEEREGGILGTGILGTITALGSIEVGGQRIVFDPQMMADGPMGPRPAIDLRPDMVVLAEVAPMGGDWQAQRLEEYVPLIGPVTIGAGGGASVLQAELSLPHGMQLEAGKWYALSGLWKGPVLMVSRAKEVPPQETAFVRGSYMDGAVGGVPVALRDVSDGQAVAVRLNLDGQTGQPLGAEAYRLGLFSRAMQMVIAEGYLSNPTPEGEYTVLGSGLVARTDNPSMIDPAARGVFCAEPGGAGRMAVIGPMPAQGCR